LAGEYVWLKRLLTSQFQYGANDSGVEYSPILPRYVRITDISNGGRLKKEGARSLSEDVANPYILSDGDVLFARSGATAGKSFLYIAEYGLCAFAGYLIRARVDKTRVLPEYLMYVTNSSDYEQWKNSVFIQATIQNISAERYGQLPVPVPTIAEQQTIVIWLDKYCGCIDKITDNLNNEITLLNEYRSRLVSDVVTGKLDVRGMLVPEYDKVEDAIESENEVEE
jgi:type I restriction enzyme S subunit